jgi:hypothetical protein
MTQSTTFDKFFLRQGLQYTRCNRTRECVGTEELGATIKGREYEIVIQRNSEGIPIKANAYRPNQKACSSNDPIRCEFNLLFEDVQLANLFSLYPTLEEEPQDIQQSKTEKNPSSSKHEQPMKSNPSSPSIHDGMKVNFTPSLALGLIGSLVAGAAVITAICMWVNRRRQKSIRGQQPNNVIRDPQTRRSSELSESDRIAIATEVMKQISPTIKKIQNDLDSKISNLVEVKFMEQYQKDQALNIKAPPISSIVPDISFAMKEPATYLPPPPPPPLSRDIIKQAVLDWSYQAIASYQFDFVTETIQSQKGEVDIKSFSIDGNQDQSDSRSQSEFIAISCQGVSYLIPNILQNAADPARTISRHLERIYKKGMGSELKNLAKLAIVRRTGDCYELVEMGQVA